MKIKKHDLTWTERDNPATPEVCGCWPAMQSTRKALPLLHEGQDWQPRTCVKRKGITSIQRSGGLQGLGTAVSESKYYKNMPVTT